MTWRGRSSINVHNSKDTRLPIADEFSYYRFGRDALAHVSRYLFVVEQLIELRKTSHQPLRVLDIGCGDIYIARVLNKSFKAEKSSTVSLYTGLDIDDKLLGTVQDRRGYPHCLKIDLRCADVTNGGLKQFKDKSYDVVVCMEMLEHIQPKFVPVVLRNINRIACGKVFLSTPNFAGGTGKLPKDHVIEWDTEVLQSEIVQAGLVIDRMIGTFCNLIKVKDFCKTDSRARAVYQFFDDKFDSNFLSLIMARVISTKAQNVLYLCTPRRK